MTADDISEGAIMLRKAFSVLTAALLLLGASLWTAGSASASDEGCTHAPAGYVCNYTHGSGARVDTVQAIRGRAITAGEICNYSADLSVQDPWGHVVYYQHLSHIGCYPIRATLTFQVHRIFRLGYVTSVAWFESGVQQGGYANVSLS